MASQTQTQPPQVVPLGKLADIQRTSDLIQSQTYDDWRQHLLDHGYAVVKGVLSKEKAEEYRQRMFDYFRNFNPNLDFDNPDTWVLENLPVHLPRNIFYYYSCSHEKFMWDVRTEPAVVAEFARLFGTDDLLVSFDAFNMTLPNRKDKARGGGWQHVDQSPFKRGFNCAQGIINFSKAGDDDGGLVVIEDSHKILEEFFDTQTNRAEWTSKDNFVLSPEQLDWFLQRGCKKIKVNVDPGDLIIWDSRTVHWGLEPEASSNTIRSIAYVSYSPRAFATEQSLQTKREVFDEWLGTSHWAHDNIAVRRLQAKFPDGTVDPRDRQEPFEKPALTPALRRLAGF